MALKFGIDFVVEQDLVPLGIKKYPNAEGYSINCPFCTRKGLKPDHKHKYSISLTKNTGHCMRCGAGHGIVTLHRDLSVVEITEKQALRDLYRRWDGLPSDVQIKYSEALIEYEEKKQKQLVPAIADATDPIYRRFLSQLTLSDRHKKDLLARGLTEEEIENGLYKSVPVTGLTTFAENSFTSEDLAFFRKYKDVGIPGFYDIRTLSPKVVKNNPGYFCPVKNCFGQIRAMQIRFDPLPEDASEYQKEHYAKYKWFTSGYDGLDDGCSVTGISINFANCFYDVESLILTEGVLKSDIASILYGKLKHGDSKPVPVVGLVGVNNIGELEDSVLFWGNYHNLKKIYIAVDMDYREKPQVKQALDNIIGLIQKNNIQYETMVWPEEFKGIDDYLLHRYQTTVKNK